MLADKKMLNLDTIEAQSVLALPDRMMPLVTIVITNVLNNLSVDVDVKNNNVAVQVCAVIAVLNGAVGTNLDCDIQQK